MPVLDIGGRRVQVDDSFLKLSPEQQNYTVDEIASSFGASSVENGRQNTVTVNKPGVAEDVVKSAGAGAVRGVTGLAGLPGTFREGGEHGARWLLNFIGDKLGLPEDQRTNLFDEAMKASPRRMATGEEINKAIEPATGKLHEPQTRAGKYARTVGEFLPNAVVPGGPVMKAASVAVPAIASEAAGQAFEGTAGEAPARFMGALAGAAPLMMASRPSTAGRALAQNLPEGVTPQVVQKAEAIMRRAADQGIDLAWPEALSQAAGRPVLTNMMRHIEASPQTEARAASFFAERPQQIDRAARATFDDVAPVNNSPSTIGREVGTAAEGAVNDVRDAINRTAKPFYDASATVRLNAQEMARVRALPGYQAARDAVRKDPQLNRYVSSLPDDSVGFLNEVKKQLDRSATDAVGPLNTQPNMQRAAGLSKDAGAVRKAGTYASDDYATALAVESVAREKYLQPLLDGPLGKIASKDTTTKKAIDALFPANPIANSQQEIATTVSALAKRNPRAANDLARAHAESVFNEAAQNLQSGANQFGGAKFATVIAGNSQQRKNLQAAVQALPAGKQKWQGFEKFLESVEATGNRMHPGSRTEYNRQFNENSGMGGLMTDAAKTASNPTRIFQQFTDRYERWKLGKDLNGLADILFDPKKTGQLISLSRMKNGSPQLQIATARLALAAQSSQSGR